MDGADDGFLSTYNRYSYNYRVISLRGFITRGSLVCLLARSLVQSQWSLVGKCNLFTLAAGSHP